MGEATGEQASTGLWIVAGLVILGALAGLAARIIPLAIALPIGVIAAIVLAVRGLAISRQAAAARTDADAIRQVFGASGAILGTLDVARVLRTSVEIGARQSKHAAAALLYLMEDGGRPVLKTTWGLEGPTPAQAEMPSLSGDVAEVGSIRKTKTVPLAGTAGTYRSACLVPLQGKSGLVGVLVLLSHKGASLFATEIATLEYFAAQIALAIDNARLYQQVQDMFVSSIKSLAAAVDAKDAYTHRHSEDIAELATIIARELQLSPSEVEKTRLAGLLHDVGKIGIPDAILRKPGKLDPAERAIMMTHATLGASIIDRPGPLRDLVAIIQAHHEHYDGRGYPDGLRGSEIPLGAAILAVADAFAALTGHRAYRAAQPVNDALEELQRHAGTQFHPQVVEALIRVVTRERDANSSWFQALESRIRESAPSAPPPDRPAPEPGDANIVWQLTQRLHDAGDLPQVLTALANATAEFTSCQRCVVLLLDERGQTLSVEAATADALATGTVFPRNRSPQWRAVEQRAAQYSSDSSVLYVPLVHSGQTVGVLQAERIDAAASRLLAVIADTAAPAVQAALLRVRAERSAGSDELTGLLNRKALVARLHQEVARHKRYGTRFALLLADIVALAQFNAQHGYEAGDDLIRRTAEVIAANIRQVDFPARLSGGTMAVLMPELDRHDAEQALRRLQAMVHSREVAIQGRFMQGQPLRWAVAGCPQDGVEADVLLAVAERRLRAEPEPSPH